MARPIKSGLDYFPFPVDFFDDEIMSGISGMFGIKGDIVVVKLLCTVYRKGYFAVWSDLLQSKIANDARVSKELVNQIVDRLVAWGFFDEGLYNSAKVLTSVDIQQTYLEATKRRKNHGKMPYLLNKDNNNSSNEVNVDNNPISEKVNVDINAQSKVKESKLKKSNKDSHDSKPAKRVYEPDDINLKLANYLLAKIRERNSSIYPTDSKNPPDTQKWANDIRLMHERDARSYDDIKRIIEWCQQDSFWQNNILSASKLRKQFGKLIDKADVPNNFSGNKGGRKPLYDLPY